MAAAEKQLRNLKLHAQVIAGLHQMSPRVRKEILSNATPQLVEALATTVRLLDQRGYQFAPSQQRRARRLMSTRVAKRNKLALVRGKPGTYSRGGKFFEDVSKAFTQEMPEMVAGGGFLDDLGNVAKIGAAVLPYVI